MAGPPIDDVREWIQVPATIVPDALLQQVIDAETLLQARACRVGVEGLTPELVQAIYRRVGREIAARGIPLGMLGADAEYGPRSLSRWDSEIERLEGPSRIVVFGVSGATTVNPLGRRTL